MLKNYLKILFRILSRNKLLSGINISGLAIGLTGFILILLYLDYELSYDSWSSSLKQVWKISEQSNEDIFQQTEAPLAGFLKLHSPVVYSSTCIQPEGDFKILLSVNDKKVYQDGGVEADSSFFKVFPYQLAGGRVDNALDNPNAIVISKKLASILFANSDPMGKTIKVFNSFDCQVTGILQEPAGPSSMNVQFVYRSPYERRNRFWGNRSYETYIKTAAPISADKLERDINEIYYHERLKKDGQSLADFRRTGHQAGLFVDAFPNLHNFPKHGSSNFKTVSLLLLLATLLLVAGAINFSNLSVAGLAGRAKEAGLKKVFGSGRSQLMFQFMTEIALQCMFSILLALLITNLLLPYFNNQFNVRLSLFHSPHLFTLATQLTGCLALIVLLSGLYPSLNFSRYSINTVLKGNYTSGNKATIFRNTLIVVQFTLSAFLIIGTLIIHQQMHFMQTKDKGFSGQQIMRLEATQLTRDKNFETTRNTLLNIPGVEYVSKTTNVPGDAITDTMTIPYKLNGQTYRMSSVKVSDDYFKTLQISLLKGRLFNNSNIDENTRSAVINEAAASKLNLADPVGQTITFPYCDTIPVQIVGVVKNFHISGFENTVQPVVFTIGNKACMFQSGGAILIKLHGSNLTQTIRSIEKSWKGIEPDFPIRYSFLDQNFQHFFSAWIRLELVIDFFSFSAILIAMMGLFAITAFTISNREKEIGIRKIMGAGIRDITLLVSKDLIGLVLLSLAVAIPVAWWAAARWLDNFAYRVSLNWSVFISGAIVIISIAMMTVIIQALKAAFSNPIKSLRSE